MRAVVGRSAAMIGLAGLSVLGAANAWVWWASRGRVHDLDDAPARPVAVVLGAGLEPDGRPSPYLAARLLVASRLLEDGRVARIVVSGSVRGRYDEPAAMAAWLVEHGVPAAAVTQDRAGDDSWATVVRAQTELGLAPGDVVLVSQAYHLPRAVALGRAAGLDPVGVGDSSARELNPLTWRHGWWRERLAAVKAMGDVLGRRPARAGG